MRLWLYACVCKRREPFVPVYSYLTARVLWQTGRSEEAIAIFRPTPPSYFNRVSLAEVYARLGRYTEAADTLQDIPSGFFLPGAIDQAAGILRSAPRSGSHRR